MINSPRHAKSMNRESRGLIRIFLSSLGILLAASFIGATALTLSFLLPQDAVLAGVGRSWERMSSHLNPEYQLDPGAYTDLDTDLHMLAIAGYDGKEDALTKAMEAHFIWNPDEPLSQMQYVTTLLGNRSNFKLGAYPRYWHGYLLYLRPALLISDYYTLRYLLAIIQICLILSIAVVATKRGMSRLLPAFMLGFLLSSPITLLSSLTYSASTMVMLVASLVLLLWHERIQGMYHYFFLITGIVCNYFDFLTFPLITLGIPLIFWSILDERSGLEQLPLLLGYSLMWLLGYAGMWFMKWVLASIFLQKNVLVDAWTQISVRTSHQWGHSIASLSDTFGYLDVLRENWYQLLGWKSSQLILLVFFAFALVSAGRQSVRVTGPHVKWMSMVFISLMPFAWSAVLQNHCYTHARFTYRIFVLTIVPIALLILGACQKRTAENRVSQTGTTSYSE